MKITLRTWGDFPARSRFVRSTIPEEKWGTTRSLAALRIYRETSELKLHREMRSDDFIYLPYLSVDDLSGLAC